MCKKKRTVMTSPGRLPSGDLYLPRSEGKKLVTVVLGFEVFDL